MFGLGTTELLVIVFLALLVLGPERIPKVASQIGKAIRSFRRAAQDLKDQIDEEGEIGQSLADLHSALRGDPPALLNAYGEKTGIKPEEKEKQEEIAIPTPLILPPTHPPMVFDQEEEEQKAIKPKEESIFASSQNKDGNQRENEQDTRNHQKESSTVGKKAGEVLV